MINNLAISHKKHLGDFINNNNYYYYYYFVITNNTELLCMKDTTVLAKNADSGARLPVF